MLTSTFDFIVSLVEADMRIEDTYFCSIQKRELLVPYGDYQLEIHTGLFLRFWV